MMRTLYMLRWALMVLVVLLPIGKVWAACSPVAGLASINEIVDTNKNKFIEVKRLSSSLTWSASQPWGIEWCVPTSNNSSTPICSGVRSLPTVTDADSPWVVLSVTDSSPSIDLQGMDVRLVDVDGRTVDYVSVENFTGGKLSECAPKDLPFNNALTFGNGNSGQYARRTPDGTGVWELASGGSEGKDTESDTNDTGSVIGPTLSIDNVTVAQGDVATFTVSFSSDDNPEFFFDFQTRDLTAIQDQDYQSSEGTVTVPAGQSQVTLEVLTWRSDNLDEREFFILIDNARDSSDNRYGRFSTQAGIATITPFVSRLDSIRIEVAASASVCAPVEVLVSARDSDGVVIDDYAGQIELATTSGSGNWGPGPSDPPEGTLSPDPDQDNNGLAEYQFVTDDDGAISLYLDNRTADALQVSATDDAEGKQGASQLVQFRDNAFLIENVNSNGLDIIAERDQTFVVRAVRQDPSDRSECGLITEYDGSVDLNVWLARTPDDAQGSAPSLSTGIDTLSPPDAQPSVDNLTFDFSAGVAPLTLQTTDVGQYRLNFLDNTSGLVVDSQGDALVVSGESELWTVRPDRFEVTVVGNPGAVSAADLPVFRRAGESFEIQVTAVGSKSNPLLSYGNEGAPQGATISNELVLPNPGESGTLSGQTTLAGADFSSGQVTISNFSWNEVGILNLLAGNPSYLGVGPAVNGQSGNVGRFIPDRFEVTVDSGELAAFCSSLSPFIYSGQAGGWLLAPQLLIKAYGPGTYVTKNYTVGGFLKLTASDVQRSAPTTDNIATTVSGLDYPVAVNLQAGTLSVVADGVLSFDFSSGDEWMYVKAPDSQVVPLSPDLTIIVDSIQDSDSVAAAGSASVTPAAPLEVRYGRWLMDNVYGPENLEAGLALEMPFSLEYWNGSRFVLNGSDDCTSWSTTDIADTENYHSLTADSGSFRVGKAGPLQLDPNGSRGTDTVIWSVDSWLQDDYDGDGTLDNPSAIATFGVYRGHDRVIYWQEK